MNIDAFCTRATWSPSVSFAARKFYDKGLPLVVHAMSSTKECRFFDEID